MTEPLVETVHTEKYTIFDDLTITGDYSYYDILEEEQEIVYLNGIVWVKVKNAIYQGRIIQ